MNQSFTIAGWATATGCDRHTVGKAVAALGIKPDGKVTSGKAAGTDTYRMRDLYKASAGGDIEAARLRKTLEEGDKLALANARSRGELIEVEEVCRMIESFFGVLRQKVLSLPIEPDEIDACLLILMSFKDFDWSAEASRTEGGSPNSGL